jgi:hypothetical protein
VRTTARSIATPHVAQLQQRPLEHRGQRIGSTRTTTTPRSRGPATAGTTTDSPNGAPPYHLLVRFEDTSDRDRAQEDAARQEFDRTAVAREGEDGR